MPAAQNEDAGRSRELILRVISSFVILPPVLFLFWVGGGYFLAMVSVLAALVAWEWASLVAPSGPPILHRLAGVIAGLMTAAAAMGLATPLALLILPFLMAGFAVLARYHSGAWHLSVLPGFVIGVAPAFALYWLRILPELGFETAFWLAISVVVTDVAAYASGRTIGGPKLWPRVSPKKTWAGLIGGMAGSAAVGALMALYIEGSDPVFLALAGALVAVVAQIGDFGESAVKRHFAVKDSSNLIPGHGGILDRIDGQVTVLPLAAVLVALSGESILLW